MSTPRGEKYVAAFIDCKSRSFEAVLLQKKSDIYEKFEDFRVRFERANDCKIKAVQSDDGTDDGGLEENIKPPGIASTRTQRCSPSANGTAESWNKIVIGRARAMLLESDLE